jgi:hypothetical protein
MRPRHFSKWNIAAGRAAEAAAVAGKVAAPRLLKRISKVLSVESSLSDV